MIKKCVLFFLCLILVGCAQLHNEADHEALLASMQLNWQVRAKFAMNEPHQSFRGYFVWQQRLDDSFHLLLQGPWGANAMTLEGKPNQAVILTDSRGNSWMDSSPEKLLKQYVNFPLPVASIPYWIRGNADPRHKAQIVYNQKGKIQTLQQHGWRIYYKSYDEARPYLPHQIELSHGETQFKILIQEWVI